MPFWFKVFLGLCGIYVWVTPISISIPFIYSNKHLLELIMSYILLFGMYASFIVIQHKTKTNQAKSYLQQLSTGRVVLTLLSSCYIPLLVGGGLCMLTPITADFIASEFQIHEYKVVKAEPYAKRFRHLSKVYVVDVYNNSTEFVLKNDMLNQLNLHEGNKLVVTGRNCIAGFVIDKINGVERK